MKHEHIRLLADLWKKPYGKPVVGCVVLLFVLVLLDYLYLMGETIHYNSHPFNSPISFSVDSTEVNYRVSIHIGNKESKYKFRYQLYNPDNQLVVEGEDAFRRNKRSFVFTPGQTGPYRLQVQSVYGAGGPPTIMVGVYKNNRSVLSHKFR